MVVLIVLLTIIVFILVDVATRVVMRRLDEARLRKERREALDVGLRLEVSDEAASLKRVEVKEPRARILAVDDEPVVLDSFRKILVLDGYSVDTVESGQEALNLVQKHDYDFVFTDLKMPGFDGLEVTKAVKHLRPDVDVVIITGYATIQSAVDGMKFGALDYVEKPFTEDELLEFTRKCLIRREDRIAKEMLPKIHLVTATSPELESEKVFNVPAGVFVSPAHVWLRIEVTGEARLGMDDFARKTLGSVERVVFSPEGRAVERGETLFEIRQGDRRMRFPSPLDGRVTLINHQLEDRPELLAVNPYQFGWICRVEPTRLQEDLKDLRIGAEALAWYDEQIARLWSLLERTAGQEPETERRDGLSDAAWEAFAAEFLGEKPVAAAGS